MAKRCRNRGHKKYWFCGVCLLHIFPRGLLAKMLRAIVQTLLIMAIVTAIIATICKLTGEDNLAVGFIIASILLFIGAWRKRDWFGA